jgi:hypothetical protein
MNNDGMSRNVPTYMKTAEDEDSVAQNTREKCQKTRCFLTQNPRSKENFNHFDNSVKKVYRTMILPSLSLFIRKYICMSYVKRRKRYYFYQK